MVRTFGIVATTNAAYYLTFTYVVERRKSQLGGGSIFLLANTVSLLLVLISKPLGGWLSDLTGRRRLMLVLTCTTMILIYPALWLMLYGTPLQFMIVRPLRSFRLRMLYAIGMAINELANRCSASPPRCRFSLRDTTERWHSRIQPALTPGSQPPAFPE